MGKHMARRNHETKAEWLAREVAKAVNAGKAWDYETVEFADAGRPPTCLEVDFPILPINQIAAIEGKGSGRFFRWKKDIICSRALLSRCCSGNSSIAGLHPKRGDTPCK